MPFFTYFQQLRSTLKAALVALAITAVPLCVYAGPPYVTDDPEPTEFRHWEVFFASQLYHDDSGWNGTAPQLEVDYGALPNLQLSVTFANAFTAPSSGSSAVGFADLLLGAKYRFIRQTKYLPDFAFYPQVLVPTASRSRGLGDGYAQPFLPIWTEKEFGEWTVNAGAGYTINPGRGNRNWWLVGALLRRKVTERLELGAEIFHETPQIVGAGSQTYFNVGGIFDVNEFVHPLLSVGHTLQGSSGWQSYVGVQFTFGPKDTKDDAAK